MQPAPPQAARPAGVHSGLFAGHTRDTLPEAVRGKVPIAVIGAGFSGTIATVQLLRRLPADQPILLCERSSEFACGVAYATGDNAHLLNVRAANMSAISEEPTHFSDWLSQRHGSSAGEYEGTYETEAGLFASRGLYGRYLRSILDQALRQTAGHAQLRLLPDHVIDIEPSVTPGNFEGFALICESGQRLDVAGVVIAVGNLQAKEAGDDRICRNPWDAKAWRKLDGDRPVLIVGTGLTMVDLAVGLRRRGFGGQILAVSRGGLLPTRHAPAATWPAPALTQAEEQSPARLLARLRQEIASARERGVDWRAVIDSMRPATARLWQGLADSERRRFLRHLRRYWDVHRHRMAPPHADLIERMQADGTLRIIAGRVTGIGQAQGCLRVTYRRRGTAIGERTLDVQRVIMASGTENVSYTHDRLIRRLMDRGLVRPDAQGMGLDVTAGLNCVRANGVASANLWALGPVVRGVFWECTAVPDIRVQASHLADRVAQRVREDAAHWSFVI